MPPSFGSLGPVVEREQEEIYARVWRGKREGINVVTTL